MIKILKKQKKRRLNFIHFYNKKLIKEFVRLKCCLKYLEE